MQKVNIKASTVGEFDLKLSVWLINPKDADDEIDVIYETDRWSDVVLFCEMKGYEIVEKPDWAGSD